MTEALKTFDKELAGAPSATSFLMAVLTKYGILGLVVCFLGWQWTVKDSQQQQTNQALIELVGSNTTAIARSTATNERMLAYLERNERTIRQ